MLRETSHLLGDVVGREEQQGVGDWSRGFASLLLQGGEYLRGQSKAPNRLFLFAQESNVATYNISRINLILHGVNSWNPRHGDRLRTSRSGHGGCVGDAGWALVGGGGLGAPPASPTACSARARRSPSVPAAA